jgi:hypothetical protein
MIDGIPAKMRTVRNATHKAVALGRPAAAGYSAWRLKRVGEISILPALVLM